MRDLIIKLIKKIKELKKVSFFIFQFANYFNQIKIKL